MKRTENVVYELLDFGISKPQVKEDVDIDLLLNEIISNVKVPDNINIHIQSLGRNIIICGDLTKLSQTFENLIVNGIQAMLDGGEFTIRTKIEDGNWGIISFTDTGVGISKENLKKVFEPLFTTKASGIGLGLAISIDYIQRIGGKIEVHSILGKGSTFDVILPILRLKT